MSETEEQMDDEAQVTLSVQWSEGRQPLRSDKKLEKALQTWVNKNKMNVNYSVSKVSEDGRAVIKIKPRPALSDLEKLCGQTLNVKDGKQVKVMYIILTPPGLETQISDNTSTTSAPPQSKSEPQDIEKQIAEAASDIAPPPHCKSEPQDIEKQIAEAASDTAPPSSGSKPQTEQPVEQSNTSSPEAVSPADEVTCILALGFFWYLNHIYNKEVEHIMTKNQVSITSNVHVTFKAQENGSFQNAYSDFQILVNKCLNESSGAAFSLKNTDSKQLMHVLKNVQEKESKLLLTLSSEQVSVYGPDQTVNALQNYLSPSTYMNPSVEESTEVHQYTSSSIHMSTKDPLLDSGLSIEENNWKLIETSFGEKLAKIKDKFGVDIQESVISQGQVQVKAHYKRSGGNASMESHALRALLQLYQKIATSPFNQPHGATVLNGSLKNSGAVHASEEASSGPELNRKSGYNTHNTEEPKGEGATAGDTKEENCSICMDPFKKKKQLKCKHEFCEACLEQSKKSLGPCCPLCKDVFGKMEGDQPYGKMTWRSGPTSLSGYSQCGCIIINYWIPGGLQTEKHPNPGKRYEGISREAYLPDNKEGNEVLRLLQKAFDQKLIFTVGMSRTTGKENQVTWNDIHHKTSTSGGPQCFGYPDPGYLSRVRDELKAKGIV
ncbi:E3 ubiquitin-protein ligase DTX3L-like isoform X2 [Labrus mixtus]|uniref:E3 ubiquitin-protein ligase DTX3L-like isoform X2 n=1 Tax=Labrus mixtus TaxID=508554 RepID=UPI0029C00286|nr:E3 ubiquitin-protein ligase DTX3L-like isoform X2 [Labrus mixtus]